MLELWVNGGTRFDLEANGLKGKDKNIDDIRTTKWNASMSECVQTTKIIDKKCGKPCEKKTMPFWISSQHPCLYIH
jgi:hypothetical protein